MGQYPIQDLAHLTGITAHTIQEVFNYQCQTNTYQFQVQFRKQP